MTRPAHAMHVAYLTNQYPGISHTFIRREIQALEELGCRVERFSIRDTTSTLVDADDRREGEKTRVLLRPLDCLISLARLAALRPVRTAKAAARAWRLWRASGRDALKHVAYLAEACRLALLLEKTSAAHLHAHFGTNAASVALLCRDLGGPPFSFTVHGPEEFDRPERIALSEKIRYAAFVVGISSFGRSQLQRWSRFEDWHKLHVVRCSPGRCALEAPATAVPQSRRLVSIGRLSEQKGQLVLLEAAARLARQDVAFELILVGDGPLRDILMARCRELGLSQCVRLVGWQTGEQIRDWFRTSRALVLPSFAEGLPVVIMEALAEARPVISTYVAGIPELVQDGRNGWLVPAGAVEPLAAAMRQALEWPAERMEAMGRCGRDRVSAMHHPLHLAQELLGLFRTARTRGLQSSHRDELASRQVLPDPRATAAAMSGERSVDHAI